MIGLTLREALMLQRAEESKGNFYSVHRERGSPRFWLLKSTHQNSSIWDSLLKGKSNESRSLNRAAEKVQPRG